MIEVLLAKEGRTQHYVRMELQLLLIPVEWKTRHIFYLHEGMMAPASHGEHIIRKASREERVKSTTQYRGIEAASCIALKAKVEKGEKSSRRPKVRVDESMMESC